MEEEQILETQYPKISIIIPIYNGGKYLYRSLRSVQNQKMKEIEIIIVDDNSSDDSVNIIKNYMKEDRRIKLIENKVNRKILFSKSIGVLNSRGKYVFVLDQDDMFIREDAFDLVYNESEKYGLDLISIQYSSGEDVFKNIRKINNLIKFENMIKMQPELKYSMFKVNKCLLWGYFINADLYKKIIYHLWPIIINYNIIFQEDYLITFFLLIYAKKNKRSKYIIFFHFVNKESASKKYITNSEYFLSLIFAGNIYYDYYFDYNSDDIDIIMNYILFLTDHFKRAKDVYSTFFNYFFGKILTNDYLPQKYKRYLMKTFKISKNCDSYEIMEKNQKKYIKESFLKKAENRQSNKKYIEISIIIITSTSENLLSVIKSLNNQFIQYLEIILFYDDEDIKEFNLIKNYIEMFHNVKLVNNKKKKGILFSICNGVMSAKGKYVMIFNKNFFFNSNSALKDLYDDIEKNNLDILEFDLYKILPNNYLKLYKCNHYSSIFNFSKIKQNLLFNEIDINKELLGNKLLKTNYFQKIIEINKLDEIEAIINEYYNDIFDFIIKSSTKKFSHTNSTKIFFNDTDYNKKKLNDFTLEENQLATETVFYINFIFDNSKETYTEKGIVIQELFNVLNIIVNKYTHTSKSSLNLLSKFYNCKYISEADKKLLNFYYNSLKN